MLLGPVGDRTHGFLDPAILDAEPFYPGIGFAAGLQRTVDQIIVVLVADGPVGARDIFGMDAVPGFFARQILFGDIGNVK